MHHGLVFLHPAHYDRGLSDLTISEGPPDQLHLRPGDRLGGYTVLQLIGSGGMGDVYRASDPDLDRPVALKVITPHLARDDRFRKRFEREWRTMAALDHPNVVAVYRAGEDAGRLFMAMRLVDGRSLESVLAADGPLAPQRAAAIVEQVAAGLDAAHAAGLVHRDVKPGNVLIADDGRAFVTDFGLTVPAQRPTVLTTTGQFMGTVVYAAPEQIRGADLDARTDVYSLGGVLYHCLTGRPPYAAGTPLEAIAAHLSDRAPRPSQIAPVPAAFDAVIARAMAKAPADRFASAGDLSRAASAALTASAPPRWRRGLPRTPWLAAGALGVAAATATAVAILGTGDRAHRQPPPRVAAAGRAISLPVPPDKIVAYAGTVWAQDSDGTLARVDTSTRRVTALPEPVDLGVAYYAGITAGAGAIWTANEIRGVGGVTRVDPANGTATARVQMARGAKAVAVGEGSAWAATVPLHGPGRLVQIDLAGNRAVRSFAVLGRKPSALATGAGSVWAADRALGIVDRIDPRTGHRTRIRVGGGPVALAVSADSVWILDGVHRTLLRVDPDRNEVVGAPVSLGKDLLDIALAGRNLWVAAGDATVSRLDARTGRALAAPVPVSRPPLVLAGDGRGVWVGSVADRSLLRVTEGH